MTHSTMPEKPRLGLVSFGFPNYTEAVADGIRQRLFGDLKAADIDLTDLGIVYNEQDAREALRKLKTSTLDGLLGVLLSWCSPPAAMRFLSEAKDLPVLLYGVGARTDSEGILRVYAAQAGAPALLRPMREAGLQFHYVFESPDEPTLDEEVRQFSRIAAARSSIRRSRIGTFGFLDMSLLTTTLDTGRLQLEIGPQVIAFDLLDIKKRSEKLTPESYEPFRRQISESYCYANEPPSREAVIETARLAAAVQSIIEEHQLDAFTIKCVEGMSRSLGLTPCMIGCLLGDEIPYICENDLPGIATHVILRKLTGQTVTFLETYEFWKNSNTVLLGACGFVPPAMVDGPLQARTFKSSLFEGIGSVSRMKSGRMTLARLIPGKDRFAMHIVAGSAKPPRDWVEVGYSMPPHPSVELKLDGDLDHFVEHISAQHFSVVYGDHSDSLSRLCDFLGVMVIRT